MKAMYNLLYYSWESIFLILQKQNMVNQTCNVINRSHNVSWFSLRLFALFAQLLSRDLYITFPLHYCHCCFKPSEHFQEESCLHKYLISQNLIHFFIIIDIFNLCIVKMVRLFYMLLNSNFIKKKYLCKFQPKDNSIAYSNMQLHSILLEILSNGAFDLHSDLFALKRYLKSQISKVILVAK